MTSFQRITDIPELGQRVRKLRRMAGLAQWQLAEQSGLSQGTISNIESGATDDVFVKTATNIYYALRRHLPGLPAKVMLGRPVNNQ